MIPHIFFRCEHKYIPPQRSSAQNKCFVLVTSGFTVLGIIYGFWCAKSISVCLSPIPLQ